MPVNPVQRSIAREALDLFLRSLNTPVGRFGAGMYGGSIAGGMGADLFNTISPVDVNPDIVAGATGFALGSRLSGIGRRR